MCTIKNHKNLPIFSSNKINENRSTWVAQWAKHLLSAQDMIPGSCIELPALPRPATPSACVLCVK